MPFSNIDKPSKYFNTITWSGDNTNRTLTGVGFQPDWVWWKQRNGTDDHRLIDSVRGEGTTSYKILFSNTTDAEYNGNDNGGSQGNINALNSDGFSGNQGTTGWNNWNGSGYNYVSWNWLASNTTASNTSGSITSTVSANTTAGFSIVSWTGNGSNSDQTLGTGLSTALDFVIAKPRDTGGGTDTWLVYASVLNMTQDQYILLNSSGALSTGAVQGTPARGSTAGQLKLFAGTTGNQNLNANGLKYIAYCFHNVKGYSKFGSRTGNGSLDGDFVYTGFKPAFVMTKRSDGVDNWRLHDNKRNTFNVVNNQLLADSSNSENTNTFMDLLSNGFKYRLDGGINTSGGKYIYMAFAENPFVSSKGIPTTAR